MEEIQYHHEPSKPIRAATVDLDTGEILEYTAVLRRPIIKHFKQDYMIMFIDAIGALAKDKTCKYEEMRVFLFLVSETAMGNWLHMSQKEIGEHLGMTQSNVSRAFRNLLAREILEVTAHLGKSKAYRISPKVGWRGAGSAYTNEMRERKKTRDKALQDAVEKTAAKKTPAQKTAAAKIAAAKMKVIRGGKAK